MPEALEGKGALRTTNEQWEHTFLEFITTDVMQQDVRTVARLLLAKTDPITTEMHKDIRASMRGTDMHERAKNSAMMRMMFGRTTPTPDLEWPTDAVEYDLMPMEAVAVPHTVQAVALQEALELEFRGEGVTRDEHPGRVQVNDVYIYPGPNSPAQCEGGTEVLTRKAVFKASFCSGARETMRGEREIEVGGHTIKVGFRLPREQTTMLNRSTTAIFLAACHARGLTEAQALALLEFCISSQLEGVTGVAFKTCQMDMGKPPHLHWNWWSASTEVQILFNSREAMQIAVIEVSKGELDLYIYDGATLERSVLAMRAYVVQNRGMQLVESDSTEVLYAGVHAATRARNHFHLFVTGYNHLTYVGIKNTYGNTCVGDPDLLEKGVVEKLCAYVPDILPNTLELIRRDTAQEEAAEKAGAAGAGKKPQRIEGRSLGGTGLRAWFWVCGARVFCTKEAAPVIEALLRTGMDADGDLCDIFPHQPPRSLTVTRVNEKKSEWAGPRAKGKSKAKEVNEEEFRLITLKQFSDLLEKRLAECKRITLPRAGDELEDQPMEQKADWPTMRNVLDKHLPLPEEHTWMDLVEHFENTCAVGRDDLVEGSDDRRLLESYDVEELSRKERAAAHAAGQERAPRARRRAAEGEQAREEGGEHAQEERGVERRGEDVRMEQEEAAAGEGGGAEGAQDDIGRAPMGDDEQMSVSGGEEQGNRDASESSGAGGRGNRSGSTAEEDADLQRRKDEADEHESDQREARGLAPENARQKARRDKAMDLDHQETRLERSANANPSPSKAPKARRKEVEEELDFQSGEEDEESLGELLSKSQAEISQTRQVAAQSCADREKGKRGHGGGAATGAAEGTAPPNLNNSMDMGEVGEEEDADIMHMELVQAGELTKQEQVQHQLAQAQHTQMQQLVATHSSANEHLTLAQRINESEPRQQQEAAAMAAAHVLQQEQLLSQQHNQQQHLEVLRALKASRTKTTTGTSPTAGGRGGQ